MRKSQFYLTLPSNSSMDYYPDNKAENYITHLPGSIQLDGGVWEVALVEAHYPNTFQALGEGDLIRVITENPAVNPAGTPAVTSELMINAPDIEVARPSQMYVYCDLADHQLVGDTVAPLLRIVNIDTFNSPYGTTLTVHFHDPHYVPVLKSAFDTVEIDLRDDKGRQLPFRFGNSCMKLHFRRATSS